MIRLRNIQRVAPRALAALFAGLLATPAFATRVTAGPMLGDVTSSTARVWLQLSTSDKVKIRCIDVDSGQEVSSISLGVTGPPPFICDAALNGLHPDRNYTIRVSIGGHKVSLPTVNIHTAPPRGHAANLSVSFGSCVHTHYPVQGAIWNAIRARQSQAFLFLGNVGYLPATMKKFPHTHRHAFWKLCGHDHRVRVFAPWQKLLRTTAIYATWDSRDYGPKHAGGSFLFKPESLQAFERFWPNPNYGQAKAPGTFCRFTIGDAEYFLLDDRMYRGAPKANGTMLGRVQLKWLKRRLKTSRARFKIIASGEPMVAKYDPAGSWAAFSQERHAFIAWIFRHNIKGVLFISGHSRFGQLTCRVPPLGHPNQYPLYDLTSGSLNGAMLPPAQRRANPWRVGKPVYGNNFGELYFAGPADDRHVVLELRNANGHIKLQQPVYVARLRGYKR